MKANFYLQLTMVIVIVIIASEVSPEATNAILVLVLVGIVLADYAKISNLIGALSDVAKK